MRPQTALFAVLLIGFWLGGIADAAEEAEMPTDPRRLARAGSDLTDQQAQKLEQRLVDEPTDLTARTQLLGFYFRRQYDSPAAHEARQEHVLWIIEHHPAYKIAGTPFATLDPILDGQAYARAKALWRQHAEVESADTAVLGNAADFFTPSDHELAENYLRRAKALEPENPDWPEQIAQLYTLRYNDVPADERKQLAAKAMAELELAHRLAKRAEKKFYLLDDLSEAALEAGELAKAKDYAQQLLQAAEKQQKNWNYGNAIHTGHTVLGKIALRSDDVAQARVHLLESGRTPGSPQLNSFGPSMTLAQALLERGEQEAVLEYLQLVSRFWENDRGQIKRWTQAIKKGDIPDFGALARR